jgi:predicted PurR-regulated permease PerM
MVSAIVATVVLAVDVLMLLFLGLLLGVFLCQCSTMLGRVTPWHYAINLGGITVLLLSIAMGTLFGLGVSLDNQFDKASANLDSSVEKIEKWLKSRPTVFDMVKKVPFSNELFSKEFVNDPLEQAETTETAPGSEREWNGRGERSKSEDSIDADPLQIKKTAESAIRTAGGRVIQTVRKMMGTTFGLLANVGIIFFVGIFLASDPVLYRDGFAKLFPIQRRSRIAEVMDLMAESMFRWIIGRFIAMLLTGVGTAIVLAVLGVPMPITIGIATGLLTFIPNIGGIIALVLAALMALSQGPMTVVWVVVAYGAIQLVESNLITPMIQQYQTSIPPALLISFQLIFGVLNGFLGIMIATPLLAAILPMVKEFWIKDALGDST